MKERRYLITTADESTWKTDRPVLFLGEWCKLYSRRAEWSKLDAKVLPYHWQDFGKLDKDIEYLKTIYEVYLAELASLLNEIHGVNHELRYWRILIGPWLACFIQILFDRWSSISLAMAEYDISGTTIRKLKDANSLVPNDMGDLDSLIVGDDWNQLIFNMIIEKADRLACEHVEDYSNTSIVKHFVGKKSRVKRSIANAYMKIASIFAKETDAFFISTYLPGLNELQLQMRLKQFPQRWSRIAVERVAINWKLRTWIISNKSDSGFESFVGETLSSQIPRSFLEGYSRLKLQVSKVPWPKRPKYIFTSNDLWFGTVTMAYTAEKVEQGSSLVYGQHGGVYGITKYSWEEEHETRIADKYLSWGWTDASKRNIVPLGMITRSNFPKPSASSDSKILLILGSNTRYSRIVGTAHPFSSGLLNYYNDTYCFVESLPLNLRSQLLVRPYMHELGWEQRARWRDKFPNINLDNGELAMRDLIRGSRILIHTYNSTGYLESLASDVPTLLFWNPETSPVRDSAAKYFDILEEARIFHSTPCSAAHHLGIIWDDVEGWWRSAIVRAALKKFVNEYCEKPKNLLNSLESLMDGSDDRPTI